MEFTLPYDPFELHLIYQTKPGMNWYSKQRVFNELRDLISESFGSDKRYYQQGLRIYLTFFMNPKASWLSSKQANMVRIMPFSSLLKLSEYILDKTLYESNYYVRDIVAQKKYDRKPRIEMRYELYEKRNF